MFGKITVTEKTVRVKTFFKAPYLISIIKIDTSYSDEGVQVTTSFSDYENCLVNFDRNDAIFTWVFEAPGNSRVFDKNDKFSWLRFC